VTHTKIVVLHKDLVSSFYMDPVRADFDAFTASDAFIAAV
jgi:hypothetical protein